MAIMARQMAEQIAEEKLPKRNQTKTIDVSQSPYRVRPDDRIVLVDSSLGPVEIILPPNGKLPDAEDIIVKDIGGNAHVNPITITPEGISRLDGAEARMITTAEGSAEIWTQDKNWVTKKDAALIDAGENGLNGSNGSKQTSSSTGQHHVEFNFRYNGTVKIASVAKGKTVLSTTLVVSTAFNDNGSTMSLGTNGNNGAIFTASEVSPNFVATYRSEHPILVQEAQDIFLTINPGNSTTGSGYVVVTTT
tara:strand:+ start:18628 stop:19374 length:747 start_codon:yes stop_codon:yes gene_type:complete